MQDSFGPETPARARPARLLLSSTTARGTILRLQGNGSPSTHGSCFDASDKCIKLMKILIIVVLLIVVFVGVCMFLNSNNMRSRELALQDNGTIVTKSTFDRMRFGSQVAEYDARRSAILEIEKPRMTIDVKVDGKAYAYSAAYIGRIVWSRDGARLYFVKSDKFHRSIAWVGRQVGTETLVEWSELHGFRDIVSSAFIVGPHQSPHGDFLGFSIAQYRNAKPERTVCVLDTKSSAVKSFRNILQLYSIVPCNSHEAWATMLSKESRSKHLLIKLNLNDNSLAVLGSFDYVFDLCTLPGFNNLRILAVQNMEVVDLIYKDGRFEDVNS